MYNPFVMAVMSTVFIMATSPAWFPPIGKWLIKKLQEAEAKKTGAQKIH